MLVMLDDKVLKGRTSGDTASHAGMPQTEGEQAGASRSSRSG